MAGFAAPPQRPGWSHADAGGFQIGASGLAAHTGSLLDPSQRPAESA